MKKNKLVSVVMPTFGHAEWVRTAVMAVLCQTYPSVELILVSVEGDEETENTLASSNLCFRQVVSPKADHIHQINLGLKEARGDFISIAGSDDFTLPSKLESEMRVAEERNALLVYSRFFIGDEHLNILSIPNLPEFSYERLVTRCFINDCSLVSEKVYDEFGLLDESLGSLACYDKWLHVAEKYSDRIALNRSPAFIYRSHSKQKHTKRLSRPEVASIYEGVVKASLQRKGLPSDGVKFTLRKIENQSI